MEARIESWKLVEHLDEEAARDADPFLLSDTVESATKLIMVRGSKA